MLAAKAESAAPHPRHRRRDITVIYNPTAGSGRRRALDAVLDAYVLGGGRVTLRSTRCRGDAEAIAAEIAVATQRPDALVVAGGDGTLNEAANGLAHEPQGLTLPLGLIPLGTANVLAHEVGLPLPGGPRRCRDLADVLATGPVRPIRLGVIEGRTAEGDARCRRHFVLMAGVGFDAHVVSRIDSGTKRWLGKSTYVWGSLKRTLAGVHMRYGLTLTPPDGAARRDSAAQVIVCNARYYAGTFVLAPTAGLDAPGLEACVFQHGGRFWAAAYGLAMVLGFLRRLPGYRVSTVDRMEVPGPAGDPVQADGDLVARLPAEIGLAPASLNLIAPHL